MLKHLTCSVALLVLCSCAAEPNIRDNFGNAAKHNIAVQTLNPLTTAEGTGAMDGQKARQAIERYRQPSAPIDDQSLVTE